MVVERRISAAVCYLTGTMKSRKRLTFEYTTILLAHTNNVAVVELHDEA
jgi:hypothetical protein